MIEVFLFAEAPTDARTAAVLIDRICGQDNHRFRGVTEDSHFTRRGPPEAQMGFTKWGHLKRISGARVRGRRGAGHATEGVRRAIRLATDDGRRDAIVVVVKDDDHRHDLTRNVDRLIAEHRNTVLAIGVPIPEVEIWRLHAFEPIDDAERDRLQEARQDLGADPRVLDPSTSKSAREFDRRGQSVKRNVKRIERSLADNGSLRGDEGFATIDLDTLRRRGQTSGLTRFLDHIIHNLRPALCR